MAVFLLTALVVFLLARPVAKPTSRGTPPASTGTRADTEVIVTPDFRGLTYAEALSRIEEANLTFARRVKGQGEPGIVVATDPSLGQLVPAGTPVTVFVGADPEPPDEEALLSA